LQFCSYNHSLTPLRVREAGKRGPGPNCHCREGQAHGSVMVCIIDLLTCL
jgi:hypothetical protein